VLKVKIKGHSVIGLTDYGNRRKDRQTDRGDGITSLVGAVGIAPALLQNIGLLAEIITHLFVLFYQNDVFIPKRDSSKEIGTDITYCVCM